MIAPKWPQGEKAHERLSWAEAQEVLLALGWKIRAPDIRTCTRNMMHTIGLANSGYKIVGYIQLLFGDKRGPNVVRTYSGH